MTDEYLHPLVVDGVRHASNCRLFAYWNGRDEPEKCSCGGADFCPRCGEDTDACLCDRLVGYPDPKDPTVKITHIDITTSTVEPKP